VLRRFEVLALIAFLVLSLLSFADQVSLKNGDRLTGTVVKSEPVAGWRNQFSDIYVSNPPDALKPTTSSSPPA
jgi:hypothetical protein